MQCLQLLEAASARGRGRQSRAPGLTSLNAFPRGISLPSANQVCKSQQAQLSCPNSTFFFFFGKVVVLFQEELDLHPLRKLLKFVETWYMSDNHAKTCSRHMVYV